MWNCVQKEILTDGLTDLNQLMLDQHIDNILCNDTVSTDKLINQNCLKLFKLRKLMMII